MPPLRLLVLLCSVLATAGLTGCGADPINAREGAREKIFLINNKAEPRFLDLQRCNSVTEHHIMLSLYQGLVSENRDSDKDVEPGMAEKWETPNGPTARLSPPMILSGPTAACCGKNWGLSMLRCSTC